MMLKAQVTIEFLLSFLVFAVLLSTFQIALVSLSKKAAAENEQVAAIIDLEEVARMEDALSSTGTVIVIKDEVFSYRIENNSIRREHNKQLVTVEGVFNVYKKKAEPV